MNITNIKHKSQSTPPLYALFQDRLKLGAEGLERAAGAFARMGLGAEIYARSAQETADCLDVFWRHKSPGAGAGLHLSRKVKPYEDGFGEYILEVLEAARGRAGFLVLHDARTENHEKYIRGIREAADIDTPLLCIEYAAGLDEDTFVGMVGSLGNDMEVGCCIDIGHVGLAACRSWFREATGRNLSGAKHKPDFIREHISAIVEAVTHGEQAVHSMIKSVSGLGCPVHFHLHDAHPLLMTNPSGLSDHAGFGRKVALDFEHEGRAWVPPMFAMDGLSEIVALSLGLIKKVSYTIEVHPAAGGDVHDAHAGWMREINEAADVVNAAVQRHMKGRSDEDI